MMRSARFAHTQKMGFAFAPLGSRFFAAAVGMLVASSTQLAHAQDFRLHGIAAAAHAITGHQKNELSFGVTGRAAFEIVLIPQLGIYGQLSGTWLGAGDLPTNPRLAPLDAAKSYGAMAGIQFRPLARKGDQRVFSPGGLWLGGGGGMAYTGGTSRPTFEALLGYDLRFSKLHLGLGPVAGLEHIFQDHAAVRPDDANIVFLGVHGMFEIGLPPETVDRDTDNDGILDSVDKCPTDPEDKDGFEDEDGCPDKDNDQDSIVDTLDKCPNVAEDKDGFQDDDGCPEADNDNDGILDYKDKCPDMAEDKDGFEDTDGCPDWDNDNDQILDKDDLCPNEPEVYNGYADTDGCPDAEQIRVVGDKIVLDDRVHFLTNAHIIQQVSHPLLTRLARLIKDHPEYIHIDVQGHCDERGPAWFNDRLSQDRADAVMEFLIAKGINRERLSSHGFGNHKPLDPSNTEKAWAANRRVEFEITRQNQQSIVVRLDGNLPVEETATPVPSGTAAPATTPAQTPAPAPTPAPATDEPPPIPAADEPPPIPPADEPPPIPAADEPTNKSDKTKASPKQKAHGKAAQTAPIAEEIP